MNNSSFLDRVFHLAENGTTVKTEILAGITTFMTMAYILAVNPIIMGSIGMDKGAVLTATCIASFIGTLLISHIPWLCLWDIPGKWRFLPCLLKGLSLLP